MASEATSLGDYIRIGVGCVKTHGDKAPESGVKETGSATFTGFYPNWSKLLDITNQSIFNKRERLNTKGVGTLENFDKKKQSIAASIKDKNKAAYRLFGK